MIQTTNEAPPSYDIATSDAGGSSSPRLTNSAAGNGGRNHPKTPSFPPADAKSPHGPSPQPLPTNFAQPQQQLQQQHSYSGPNPTLTTLYHYQNPHTGQTVASHLPPDHPAMQCLQTGVHVPGRTQWGLLGVLSAVLFFPLGVALCVVDRKVECRRCGETLHRGLSA